MNSQARRKLIDKVTAMLEEGTTLPAVPMEEFFDGNTDQQSIGVNLPPEKHIGLEGFHRVLREIQNRDDVQAVFIELTEVPDPDEEEDDDIWPTACVAFIITSASTQEVAAWVKELHPRDVSEGWNVRAGVKTPVRELDPGMRVVRVWLL